MVLGKEAFGVLITLSWREGNNWFGNATKYFSKFFHTQTQPNIILVKFRCANYTE